MSVKVDPRARIESKRASLGGKYLHYLGVNREECLFEGEKRFGDTGHGSTRTQCIA
jgi:hypothetical protein